MVRDTPSPASICANCSVSTDAPEGRGVPGARSRQVDRVLSLQSGGSTCAAAHRWCSCASRPAAGRDSRAAPSSGLKLVTPCRSAGEIANAARTVQEGRDLPHAPVRRQRGGVPGVRAHQPQRDTLLRQVGASGIRVIDVSETDPSAARCAGYAWRTGSALLTRRPQPDGATRVIRTPNRAASCGVHLVPLPVTGEHYLGATSFITSWLPAGPAVGSAETLIHALREEIDGTLSASQLTGWLWGSRNRARTRAGPPVLPRRRSCHRLRRATGRPAVRTAGASGGPAARDPLPRLRPRRPRHRAPAPRPATGRLPPSRPRLPLADRGPVMRRVWLAPE